MHIISLFSYTLQLEELLNFAFLLILRLKTYPDVAKASTHYCMYTIQISSCFFWVLDHSRDCTVVIVLLRTTSALKVSVLPPDITLF